MITFMTLALTIFICGFLIARFVNVFTNNATSMKRDVIVTFFQGIGLAAVVFLWGQLSEFF